ncbi:MAG: hypothetical protein QOF44_5032, partial [Streptomyces sp.]|nr:hypothetical protein [Streptomyces sp.]
MPAERVTSTSPDTAVPAVSGPPRRLSRRTVRGGAAAMTGAVAVSAATVVPAAAAPAPTAASAYERALPA